MSFLIKFVRQWIAGETKAFAISCTRKSNNSRIGAIINFLGEHVREEAEANKNIYKSPFFAIATHDEPLINEALEANKAHHKRLEFQMLMGVREELKHELVRKGLTLVDYIPYGKNCFPYSVGRIRERKRNILLILRSIFDF